MRLFGWSRKFYFPEIEIRWLKKTAFDHGNAFTLLFSLQSISGKWERERKHVRARERRRSRRDRELQLQSEITSSSPSSSSSPRRDRDLAKKARSRSRRRSRCRIAIAMSDRDRAVIAITVQSSLMILCISGLWLVFSDLFFPSSFPNTKHQKIFFGKFFKMQPNTWKYFPFPKISISGKYVFSGKRFTATKHSLYEKVL